MNRVVFIFLSILLIVFPLTFENIENENVAEFETSSNESSKVWSAIEDWINEGYPSRKPFVDWMND